MNKNKKMAIFNAAIKIFSIEGYDSATVDEIAVEAGVAKGTLYYNFNSKEELFKFVIQEGLTLIKDGVEEAVKDISDPFQRLTVSAKIQLRYVYQNKDFFRVVLSQIWGEKNRHQEMRQELKRVIKLTSDNIKCVVKEEIDTEVLDVLGCCFIGILFSSALYEILYEDQYDEDEMIRKFMEYIDYAVNRIQNKI